MLGETTDRTDALEEFKAALRDLRARAGDPSFRRMAEKSGAISHATLHLTVTGHRLQPWETVREFVRACDGDETAWHARWRATFAELSDEESADEEPGGAPAAPEPPEAPETRGPARRWRSPRLLAPLAVVAVVIAVAVAVVVVRGHTAADSARPARNSDPHAMVYKNDASTFVRDVTYPDGTEVKPDSQFVKTWEVRNTGGVEWRNRYLQRIDLPIRRDDCATPERVPVNHTFPSEKVQITVPVRTPQKPGVNCKVRWKMVDANGRVLMPGYRPLFFDVRVRR